MSESWKRYLLAPYRFYRERSTYWPTFVEAQFGNPKLLFPVELSARYLASSSWVVRSFRPWIQDSVLEQWRRQPGSAQPDVTINIRVCPLRSQAEALAWGRGLFSLCPTSPPVSGVGRPDCGSFSGRPIGEHCWNAKSTRHPSLILELDLAEKNETRCIFSVYKNCLVRLEISGKIVDEDEVEELALILIERLKTWKRPGLLAQFFPGKPLG